MQKLIFDALSFLPFLIISRNQEGALSFSLSWSEVLRSVIVPFLIASITVMVTIEVMKKDIQFQAQSLSRMEAKLDSVCREITDMNRELAIVKTRQDERIERERAIGIRR
jgi:hypothetical protein